MAKDKKNSKLRNTIALKRNVYAVVLSVIFIVAVVLLTTLSTVLARKYPLDIDLTTNKQHSISDSNFEYISSVDEKINIYVTATEEAYNSSTGTADDVLYIAASMYVIDNNSFNQQYLLQTVELLKKYAAYNDNINVTFVDTVDAKARDITDRFSDFDWGIGDILVESTFKLDGKDVTRRTVVPLVETYTLDDVSGVAAELAKDPDTYMILYGISALLGQGYGYMITENKIETMISSAIYKVTSPDTPVFLVPTSISDSESVAAALENTLEVNNFAVEYNDGLLSTLLVPENYEKYAGIVLSDCKADITESDRQFIENFLDNKGQKGKSLFYFAGVNTMNLTNLRGLLGDWGIGFEDGILYETNPNFHASGDPNLIVFESSGSDFTTSSDAINKYGVAKNLTNMKVLWPSSTTATYTRETTVLMATASLGMTAVMPVDADPQEWTVPDDPDALDKRILGVLSEDSDSVENQFVSSYVVAYASADIIGKTYNTASYCNLDLVLNTFNAATGNADAPFSFVPKQFKSESYYANVTQSKTTTVKWIFMAAVPVIFVGLGIFVWIWRKRK